MGLTALTHGCFSRCYKKKVSAPIPKDMNTVPALNWHDIEGVISKLASAVQYANVLGKILRIRKKKRSLPKSQCRTDVSASVCRDLIDCMSIEPTAARLSFWA